MSLTLEPLADSLLTPRRDRLHARSPATVAASASSRPRRLLPLRVAGGRKSRSRFGEGRWRIALLRAGTGKSPPCCPPIARNCQARAELKTPPSFTPTPSLPGGIVCARVCVHERCCFITSLIVPCAITYYARRRRRNKTTCGGKGWTQ